MSKICGRGNEVKVHWVPGHKDIEGMNWCIFMRRSIAAEISGSDVPILPGLDKTEAILEITSKFHRIPS